MSLAGLLAGGAVAVGAQENAQSRTLIYDYAVDHPTENADLASMPSIGASVPSNVVVATSEDDDTVYGYFYYEGRPVIVDLTTRSVVRIGN
ncbi:hypothetical protein [Aureimonas mangrovi]|uniref:hypothetical protein n=1 Tax=Aureimonas mangrovi TaxID=2758041 RepID=UPI00163D76E7|nr:hypothetical protein [Aureimonas mangrovi]